ncbi:MAG: sigma-70 family RNA polymerase sigma factor [Rhodothermales bacterium]
MNDSVQARLDRIHRQEHGQILATLVSWLGDFERAEDAVQDALLEALERWPRDGVPDRPGAWLTTVARRKALDRLRRSTPEPVAPELLAAPGGEPGTDEWEEEASYPDERLKLMFTCCHPALPLEQQVALTLHTLGGLTTTEIASAFLVPTATMAQRLVRAKRKIREAGIPFHIPPPHRLAGRIDAVLHVLYLIYTEGYAASAGDALIRGALCEEAIHLCRLLEGHIRAHRPPTELHAEILGLLALMLLSHARRDARLGPEGALIVLDEQDRARWDSRHLAEGLAHFDVAMRFGVAGPYQIQAAIHACHALADPNDASRWGRIATLYEQLLAFTDTPIVRLNRAVAVSLADSPEAGLALLVPLEEALRGYGPYYLARGDMHERAGQKEHALAAYRSAQDLTQNAVERAHVERRVRGLRVQV